MAKTITIDPVTRIEGHAKITIHLDDADQVADAKMHVTQFRGFERFIEGRPLTEMPSLMARICGICPVSHLVASAKACDDLLAVEVPPVAVKLRKLMNLAQLVQSHALSFFHLSSPDLMLGMDADPATRNVFGLIQKHPELARDGVMLRKFGQHVIELLGGKRIHPSWIVSGGVNAPLDSAKRDEILAMLPDAMDMATRTLEWYGTIVNDYADEIASFANFESLFMGLVDANEQLEHYDGRLRMANVDGQAVATTDARHYGGIIGEAVEPWTYLKFPYYKPHGYPGGIYRVGPLARLNIVKRCGTPRADEALAQFRFHHHKQRQSSFHYHYARLIEIVYGLEMIYRLLADDDILDDFVRARARPNRFEGVGVSEAPRGTLIHHYAIDRNGLMKWANLIIATGHNNLAINHGITQVARRFVDGRRLSEGMLNRVEAVVRAFDPCLSCSTHALGQMPLNIELHDAAGQIVDRIARPDEAGAA